MRTLRWPLFLLLAGCAAGAEQAEERSDGPATRYEPDPIPLAYQRTDGATIHFADGSAFETGLYDLRYIGQVQHHGGKPWLIMAGRYCTECDAELALYIHSPSHGAMEVENGAGAHYHPGRMLDGETGEPWYEGRTFFGEVLEETAGVIWYEKITHPDGTVQEITTLLDLDGERPIEQQFLDQDRLPKTLELMSRGLCTEIPGIDQTSAP